jgi:hypothetical protein
VSGEWWRGEGGPGLDHSLYDSHPTASSETWLAAGDVVLVEVVDQDVQALEGAVAKQWQISDPHKGWSFRDIIVF